MPGAVHATVRSQLTRSVTNLPLQVPLVDWPHVIVGRKRMFRTYSNQHGERRLNPVIPPDMPCPRPCLLYAARYVARRKQWMVQPGFLLAHRQEPLGAITPQDLQTEGFSGLPAFRYYWRQRHQTLGWRPWDMVSVIEVRPFGKIGDTEDHGAAASWLLEGLYGEWLDE